MKIFVDFDGVICKSEGIPTKRLIWNDREPVKDALDAINFLIKVGHEITIFTSNPEPEKVKEWLENNHFPKLPVTDRKSPAHAYILKWAVRFSNWEDIVDSKISKKESDLKKKWIGKLPKLSDAEWGYMGGLIDGEGSFNIGKNGQGRFYLRIMVANQHIKELEWLKDKFGGAVNSVKKENHFPVSYWSKSGISLKLILEKLISLNCLRMKKNQAELAMEFLSLNRYNGRKKSKLSEVKMEQLREGIMCLNKYGIWFRESITIDDRAIRFTNWQDIRRYFG